MAKANQIVQDVRSEAGAMGVIQRNIDGREFRDEDVLAKRIKLARVTVLEDADYSRLEMEHSVQLMAPTATLLAFGAALQTLMEKHGVRAAKVARAEILNLDEKGELVRDDEGKAKLDTKYLTCDVGQPLVTPSSWLSGLVIGAKVLEDR
jgi:hypothetical protein